MKNIAERIKERPIVSVMILIATAVAGLASFTQSLDSIASVARKWLGRDEVRQQESPGPRSSQTDRVTARTQSSPTTAAGRFDGYEWHFAPDRGIVQLLPEKINLFTHRAEALAWIDKQTFSNFELSAAFELISGDTSLGFGPAFWLHDERTFYHFAVRTAREYRLVRYQNGTEQELIPWTQAREVRPVLTRQNVKIRAIGTRIRMFIEGNEQGGYEVPQRDVGKVGFYAVDGGLSVSVVGFQVSGSESGK
jgi:hypothetical protein